MKSSLPKTMELLRKQGYIVEKVEMPWNPYTKKRKDFLGLFDAIGVSDTETIGIQSTTATNKTSHIQKMRSSPNLSKWCKNDRRAILVLWSKKGAKGKRKLWKSEIMTIAPLPF